MTNIPGPQVPLYVLGRQLEDLFPLAFLPKNHALAVAIMSYNGGLDYGLLGDYDALPDIDVIADGIDASLQELLAAAHGPGELGDATAATKSRRRRRREVAQRGRRNPARPPAPRPKQGPAPTCGPSGPSGRGARPRESRSRRTPCRFACKRLPFRATWTT